MAKVTPKTDAPQAPEPRAVGFRVVGLVPGPVIHPVLGLVDLAQLTLPQALELAAAGATYIEIEYDPTDPKED